MFAFWNIAHNVGGGLTGLIAAYSTAWMGWRSAFYVPGVLAILCAVYLICGCATRRNPWACRPSRSTRTTIRSRGTRDREEELGTRELLVTLRSQEPVPVAVRGGEFLRLHRALQHARLGTRPISRR